MRDVRMKVEGVQPFWHCVPDGHIDGLPWTTIPCRKNSKENHTIFPLSFSMPYDSAYNRQYDWGFCTEGKIKANCKTYCLRSDNPYTGMTVTQVGLSSETFQWNTYSLSSANVSLIVRVLLARNHWRKNRRTPLVYRCPRKNFTYAPNYLYENFFKSQNKLVIRRLISHWVSMENIPYFLCVLFNVKALEKNIWKNIFFVPFPT